jgi:DNA-binding LacI/PurR family transcriptional regulator
MIFSGQVAHGEFLPSLRELCRKRELSADTVLRAMRSLEREGLIAAEPRRGYRVLAPREAEGVGSALAFLVPYSESDEIGLYHGPLLNQLQKCADLAGKPLLAVGGSHSAPEEVAAQLRSHKVCGVAINNYDAALLAALTELQLPTVGVDIWHPDMRIDTVIQDGFTGGYLAAQHLADRGHKRVAYVGRRVPRSTGLLAADRLGGAVAGLVDSGLELPGAMRLLSARRGSDGTDLEDALEELLERPSRPTAIIALWGLFAEVAAAVADRLGLELGKDLEIVGWGVDEGPVGRFPQEYRPARVSWSIGDMAQTAVDRLETRSRAPGLPPAALKVPVRLRA